MADATKLQFDSAQVTDKIAVFSSKTDSSGIGTNGSMTAVAPAVATDVSTTIATIANPYGRRLLPNISWSLDGVSYLPLNQPIYYYNATFASYLWQALAFAGCSDTLLYFGVDSQYTSNQTVYFQFAFDNPT